MSDSNLRGRRYAVVPVDEVLLYTDNDVEHCEWIVRTEPVAYVVGCDDCSSTREVGQNARWCKECAEISKGERWCLENGRLK